MTAPSGRDGTVTRNQRHHPIPHPRAARSGYAAKAPGPAANGPDPSKPPILYRAPTPWRVKWSHVKRRVLGRGHSTSMLRYRLKPHTFLRQCGQYSPRASWRAFCD